MQEATDHFFSCAALALNQDRLIVLRSLFDPGSNFAHTRRAAKYELHARKFGAPEGLGSFSEHRSLSHLPNSKSMAN
jgi:hypothetical protein